MYISALKTIQFTMQIRDEWMRGLDVIFEQVLPNRQDRPHSILAGGEKEGRKERMMK